MTHRTRLGPALLLAGLAAGTSWFTLLSWRILTSDAASVTMPLFLLAIAIAVGGATARWMRVPGAAVVLGQVAVSALWLLFVVTGSMLPTGATIGAFGDAFSAGLESARLYEAPVPPNVPPVHALLLVGGALTLLATDLFACTLRRVPLAGLVLLTAYSVPVSVTGEGTSWWTFVLVAAGFLAMMFIAHEDQVTRWGREVEEEDADPTGFGVRTGAVRGSAVAIGASATAMALTLPVLIPTLDVALFDGQGPGKREIQVADPMVDLRRDLVRGEDRPLVLVSTDGERPTYLRYSVLTRFNGDTWTPGDRDIPETQVARGEMPALDGVDPSVPREESEYRVQVSTDFESTWLPTTAHVADIQATGDWRYDTSTMDFISADDEVTTAGKSYDFTAVSLELDGAAMDRAVSGAADVRAAYLEVPPSVSSNVRTLAAAVTGDAPTRFRKARALQQWFREDGGFSYDVNAAEDAADGDLDSFLDARHGPGGLLRAVRGLDGDHGPDHRDPVTRGGRLPRAAGRPVPTPGSSPPTTCTPGPSSTSPAPAGCGSSPHRVVPAAGPRRCPSTPVVSCRPSRSRRPPPAPPARRRRCRTAARPRRPTPRPPRTTRAPRSRGCRSCWCSWSCCWSPRCCWCPASSGASGANAASRAASRRRGRSCATWPSTWATAGPEVGRLAPSAPGSGSASVRPGPRRSARTGRAGAGTSHPRAPLRSTGW